MTQEPSKEKPPKPPWRIRLRSWKWWVYGAVDSQPLEQLPKGLYKNLTIAITLWVVIAFHPWVTTFINREPPPFDQLKLVEGTIVGTYEKNPHVILKTHEGVNMEMEFPVFLNTLGQQIPSFDNRYLGQFNRNLVGCEGRIWYDIPVGTLWTRYRIWQVECPNLGLDAPYSVIKERPPGLMIFGFGVFFFLPLIGASILFRMSRGNYR